MIYNQSPIDPLFISNWSSVDPQLIPKWYPNDTQMIPKWSQIDPKFNPPLSPLLTIKIKNRNKIFTWILLITFIYQYCTLHKAYLTYIITNSFLFIYLGLIWNEIKQLWDNGPKEYIRKNTLAYNLIKSNHLLFLFLSGGRGIFR